MYIFSKVLYFLLVALLVHRSLQRMTKYVDVHLTMRAYSYQLRAMLGTLLTGLHLGDSKPIKLIPIGLFLS